MSQKRKRVVLSLQQKTDIVERLKKGESGNNIALEYGIGTSTVSDIKKNSASILNFVAVLEKEEGSAKRKTMKKSNLEDVDKALYV